MGGFRWSVMFRLTPLNGIPQTIALDATTLTEGRGPLLIHPSYEPDDEIEEDVLRSMRVQFFGWRLSVELGFRVGTMTDQAVLAEIRDALASPRIDVEMSLDGGSTYRAVIGRGDFGPGRLNGKWTAGAEYSFTAVCKDLLTELPRIASVDASGDANTW